MSPWWPKIRIGDMRGRWWVEVVEGRALWMMATWHPSAILRSGGLQGIRGREWFRDLLEFRRVLCGGKRERMAECVKCGRGGNPSPAVVWERGIGACGKHSGLAGFKEAR